MIGSQNIIQNLTFKLRKFFGQELDNSFFVSFSNRKLRKYVLKLIELLKILLYDVNSTLNVGFIFTDQTDISVEPHTTQYHCTVIF